MPQCSALNLSDERKCEEEATASNGLFCSFHAKQCHGLYLGYKRRNAHLDKLNAKPPPYLRDRPVPLSQLTFDDVPDVPACRELHDHLFRKHALLDRVIRARRLHHARFFAQTMDYGHARYLEHLQNERAIVLRAIERLAARAAALLYRQERWYAWVRARQADDERRVQGEAARAKREGALFRRHAKELAARQRVRRAREEERRQADYLEKVYRERMAAGGEEREMEEDEWFDPIEDVIEEEREIFLDLLQHFLWLEGVSDLEQKIGELNVADGPLVEGDTTAGATGSAGPSQGAEDDSEVPGATDPSTAGKKKKKKKKPTVALPEKSSLESRAEIRERLINGASFADSKVVVGYRMEDGSMRDRDLALDPAHADEIVAEIAMIKRLMFCRALLSNAMLLPTALRSESIEEFLRQETVATAELRNLALAMEQPSIQAIRDACADLFREDEKEEEFEAESDESEDEDEDLELNPIWMQLGKRGKKRIETVPRTWNSRQERQESIKDADIPGMAEAFQECQREADREGRRDAVIDFGAVDGEGKYTVKKTRVKVCGHYIYNYPSKNKMPRRGWLLMSVLMKDISISDAARLCRTWDEFVEVMMLSTHAYFLSPSWITKWFRDGPAQVLLPFGIAVFFALKSADALTRHSQAGRHRRGPIQHHGMEVRNFICGHVRRDAATSRRFIQYLSMETSTVCVLVRDAKTGRILIAPPDEELWLLRTASGTGRIAKAEWTVQKSVGREFFEEADRSRPWGMGFRDYYDVYAWDRLPGNPIQTLLGIMAQCMMKAHRFRNIEQVQSETLSHLYRSLVFDPVTHRIRDKRPDDDLPDLEQDPPITMRVTVNPSLADQGSERAQAIEQRRWYGAADEAEARILFPDEDRERPSHRFRQIQNALTRFENTVPSIEEMEDCISVTDYEDHMLADESESEWEAEEDDVQTILNKVSEEAGGDEEKIREILKSRVTAENIDKVNRKLIKGTSQEGKVPDLDIGRERDRVWEIVSPLMDKLGAYDEDGLNDWQGSRKEFMDWLDRSRAKTFKYCWHMADTEEDAQQRWKTLLRFLRDTQAILQVHICEELSTARPELIAWLGLRCESDLYLDDDIGKACAMVKPFFPARENDFWDELFAEKYKSHPIVDQHARKAGTKRFRRWMSSARRSNKFFREWDAVQKTGVLSSFPQEWDVLCRPIVATLFRAGIIYNGYMSTVNTAGHVIGYTEDGCPLDMHIDYRPNAQLAMSSAYPTDPTTIDLKTMAKCFAAQHPAARFSFLRVWTAPYFAPLMIGYDKRTISAFVDSTGERVWMWKFAPKDQFFTEHAMHNAVELRLAPFRAKLNSHVKVKRDMVLVLAPDEKACRRFTEGTVYALQTRPWRLEVDLWKSFINVDFEFLDSLEDWWWE